MITKQQLLSMPESEYMNDVQLSFFRSLLIEQKDEIEAQLVGVRDLMNDQAKEADELDRALVEEENRQRLRIADRQTKLMRKVVKTLNLIDEGEYGYCKVSGEPIGLPRLLIRPTADLCAEEKARQESRENHYIKVR
ncbi:TraR/DksA family transcriptional regulator [Sessilibacter corallicola]|uniref:TraR/DksA family transcriptional regulator n=1 Tax=Sessilibacter corallicola TaxID=2904075 RepID=UPI001E3D4AAF|nr:TraR/DksA C4-type zinc finger protein [Sessilibacter corallicola]MCE2027267.1 TraR/DksA C4-type zinc finger protein [Sessilibacter corallicola]